MSVTPDGKDYEVYRTNVEGGMWHFDSAHAACVDAYARARVINEQMGHDAKVVEVLLIRWVGAEQRKEQRRG